MLVTIYVLLSLLVGALFVVLRLLANLKASEVAFDDLWHQVYDEEDAAA